MDTVVVTGATSGIGLAITRLLSASGYRIIGIGSNETSCLKAHDLLHDEQVTFLAADLLQKREVMRIADVIETRLAHPDNRLRALINNAGAFRSWYSTTEEGYEHQFALNHLAGFMLTWKLLPHLLRARGRVIMTSSYAHLRARMHWNDIMLKRLYNPLSAYRQSKLCNLLFAQALNDRFHAQGLYAYAVDPGLVRTDIGSKKTGFLVTLIWLIHKRRGIATRIPAHDYRYLSRTEPAPEGLYFHQGEFRQFNRLVTDSNARRLFSLSEQLCDISYDDYQKG